MPVQIVIESLKQSSPRRCILSLVLPNQKKEDMDHGEDKLFVSCFGFGSLPAHEDRVSGRVHLLPRNKVTG